MYWLLNLLNLFLIDFYGLWNFSDISYKYTYTCRKDYVNSNIFNNVSILKLMDA